MQDQLNRRPNMTTQHCQQESRDTQTTAAPQKFIS